MQIAYDTLHYLSDGKFYSGTLLAQKLKVSRSSIWKGIDFLRQLGIPIQAVSGRGYRWYNPTELLNKNSIIEQLTPTTETCLPRIEIFNEIGSTNDYLMQGLSRGLPSGTVCIAERQTAGRGRMGKPWASPFGANIYLSLYWRSQTKLHDLSGLSLVVGLAILEAMGKIGKLPSDVGIKWPNDLWYQDKKLCGILIESVSRKEGILHAAYTDIVIGMGINVNMPSETMGDILATDLHHIFGSIVSRNLLISHILNVLIAMLNAFEKQGFQAFTALWAHYDLLLNKHITLTTPTSVQKGVAQGINDRGELCVKIADTLKAVRYGEVSVRPE